MKNNSGNPTSQNTNSAEIQAAKLSLIGAALSTLGDGIQTIAAGIALQELENQAVVDSNSAKQSNQTSQLELMQKQLDYLTRKIERMEHGHKKSNKWTKVSRKVMLFFCLAKNTSNPLSKGFDVFCCEFIQISLTVNQCI